MRYYGPYTQTPLEGLKAWHRGRRAKALAVPSVAGGRLEELVAYGLAIQSDVRLGPTYVVKKGMSALPPNADMCGALARVRFGPIADIAGLLDDLVGASQQRGWNVDANRFGSLQIYDELELSR